MMRPINRRLILQTAALGLLAPHSANAQDAYAGQSLTAKRATAQLLGKGNPATERWIFDTGAKHVSGVPVLHARQGQEIRLRLANELDERVLLHFFGVRGPSDQMTVLIEPGAANSVEVVFTPPDAGTFWFGPMLNASKQRAMGLYGLLIVDEVQPTPYADHVLVLEEWKLGDDGKLVQGFGDIEAAAGDGRQGNWHTVNGVLKPRIKLDPTRPARLRLFNAANARDAKVQFKGATLVLLALDGQPVNPSELTFSDLTLAPGQRADVYLRDAQPEVAVTLNLADDALDVAFLEVPPGSVRPFGQEGLPGNPLPNVDPASQPHSIEVVLEGGLRGGLKSAKVSGVDVDLRGLLEKGIAWAVNGVAGPSDQPLFEAQSGEVLIIAIVNKTQYTQPLHVHGHVWHVLEQAGEIVDNAAWRDTAVIPANTMVKLAMVAGPPGVWALQSLVAERSDSGLIATFKIVA